MAYTEKRICIVGGGAAGLMAAITAAENGTQVTILEHMPRVGKKILATGNGKCNFTNKKMDNTLSILFSSQMLWLSRQHKAIMPFLLHV